MKIQNILEILYEIAPMELAEEWDNVGLLAGDINAETDAVLCALELSEGVIAEAAEKGARLIVTHHPILFRGRKNLREDDPEGRMLCKLIREGMALYAMHTNYDNVHPGVNDALAKRLGLNNVIGLEHGMCVGDINDRCLGDFAHYVEEKLGGVVRVYGDKEEAVRRVAVLGGSGGDFAPEALKAGADVFITGEMGYHKALDAEAMGLDCLECGHAATESPAIDALAERLAAALPIPVYRSNTLVYR